MGSILTYQDPKMTNISLPKCPMYMLSLLQVISLDSFILFPLLTYVGLYVCVQLLIPLSGFTKQDLQPSADKAKPSKRDHIEKVVERKIKAIVDATKATHSKYVDPNFGPTEADPFGALS